MGGLEAFSDLVGISLKSRRAPRSVIFSLFLCLERSKATALKPCFTNYDVEKAIKYILILFHNTG